MRIINEILLKISEKIKKKQILNLDKTLLKLEINMYCTLLKI